MVTNNCTILKENLKIKLTNLLKRIPFRYLKLKELSILEENKNIHILVKIEDIVKKLDVVSFSFYAEKSKIDPKEIIKEIKESIPKEYFSITINNVSGVLNNISTNLSKKEIPNTFIISKIPYRQLCILSKDSQIFLNLSIDSYQKILEYLRKYKNFPVSIEFIEISKFLKRKELITLFLYLSQID